MGHADAREGRHVARLVSGGPTGIVGPGNMGGRSHYGYAGELPYLTAKFPSIFSVWDYVPTRSYLVGDVDAWRASDFLTDGYDRVDPSPRDHQIKRVRKVLFK